MATASPPLAIDFSFRKVAAAGAKASGYVAGIGYFSLDPTKNLTAAVVNDYHGQQLGLGAIWETTADRSLEGASAGTADAELASAQADALGMPKEAILWVNVGDFAATADQIVAIDAYYAAWYAAMVAAGRFVTGGYGTGWIIDQLVSRSRIGLWWQNAMNDVNEAGNVVSAHAFLYQRVTPTAPPIPGGGYDEDVVIVSAIPWWVASPGPAPTPPPPPPPPPIPTPPSPPPPVVVAPGFPLPAGQWFGPPSTDPRNHSGYYWPSDRPGIATYQRRMQERGWRIGVTGVFDTTTSAVTVAFQREKGLVPDDKVGPITWGAAWTAPIT